MRILEISFLMTPKRLAPEEVTAAAKTTPENNDLIGQITKSNRASRAARTLEEFFDISKDDVSTQQ